jgi:hypothetical protein
MKAILLVCFLLLPSIAYSGELVQNAKIVEVANTFNNAKQFYIVVKGGVGACANKRIVFPLSRTQSAESYQRAFSLALTAFSTGSKVRVFSYESEVNHCSTANFISVHAD